MNSMSSDELEGIKKKVKPYLEKACADSGVNMIFFMLTNILTESSELLCGGPEAKEKILNAYDLPEDTDTIMLKGVAACSDACQRPAAIIKRKKRGRIKCPDKYGNRETCFIRFRR